MANRGRSRSRRRAALQQRQLLGSWPDGMPARLQRSRRAWRAHVVRSVAGPAALLFVLGVFAFCVAPSLDEDLRSWSPALDRPLARAAILGGIGTAIAKSAELATLLVVGRFDSSRLRRRQSGMVRAARRTASLWNTGRPMTAAAAAIGVVAGVSVAWSLAMSALFLAIARLGAWWWALAAGAIVAFVEITLLLRTIVRRREQQPIDLRGTGAAALPRGGRSRHTMFMFETPGHEDCGSLAYCDGRRVCLSRKLMDNLSAPELQVVIDHETGHAASHHGLRSLVFRTLGQVGVFAVASLVVLQLGGPQRVSAWAMPALAWGLIAGMLALGVLLRVLGRRNELEADRFALARAPSPAVYRSAYRKVAELGFEPERTHPLVHGLFATHPPMQRRLELSIKAADRGLEAGGPRTQPTGHP